MSDIQRYDAMCGLEEADDGDYVSYDDHRAEVDRLTRERDEVTSCNVQNIAELHRADNIIGEQRAQLAAAEKERDEARAKRDEARAKLAAAEQAAYDRGRAHERAAVVAWLSDRSRDNEVAMMGVFAITSFAGDIERGAHVGAEEVRDGD